MLQSILNWLWKERVVAQCTVHGPRVCFNNNKNVIFTSGQISFAYNAVRICNRLPNGLFAVFSFIINHIQFNTMQCVSQRRKKCSVCQGFIAKRSFHFFPLVLYPSSCIYIHKFWSQFRCKWKRLFTCHTKDTFSCNLHNAPLNTNCFKSDLKY